MKLFALELGKLLCKNIKILTMQFLKKKLFKDIYIIIIFFFYYFWFYPNKSEHNSNFSRLLLRCTILLNKKMTSKQPTLARAECAFIWIKPDYNQIRLRSELILKMTEIAFLIYFLSSSYILYQNYWVQDSL